MAVLLDQCFCVYVDLLPPLFSSPSSFGCWAVAIRQAPKNAQQTHRLAGAVPPPSLPLFHDERLGNLPRLFDRGRFVGPPPSPCLLFRMAEGGQAEFANPWLRPSFLASVLSCFFFPPPPFPFPRAFLCPRYGTGPELACWPRGASAGVWYGAVHPHFVFFFPLLLSPPFPPFLSAEKFLPTKAFASSKARSDKMRRSLFYFHYRPPFFPPFFFRSLQIVEK